ncbi:MAG TPA: hypothetical protein VMZ52_20850 [Bryobacteraceae bacterium]|nr:hypothetical protein [Bryobacteraceae bacterium]
MKKFAMTALLAAVALPLTFAAQAPAPASKNDAPVATEKPAKKGHHKKHKKSSAAKPAAAIQTAVK